MTENNKIKEQKINELAEAFKKKDNPKNDNTLNGVILPDDEGTNIEGLENDIKKLEAAIFTDKNLENIKADEGSDLYYFLNGTDIKEIINNGHQIEDGIIISFYTRFLPTAKFHVLHVLEHYKTVDEKNNEIFDSVKDGRQPIINATIGEVKEQGCGIHAIEGVLIAEELTKNKKNIEEFKQEHKKLTETSLDDLIEQRKILFKMEILDALMSIVQTTKIEITPPENIDDLVLCGDTNRDEKQKNDDSIACINKLYELYFKEFKARCAALQAVKQELGLEPDKVKLDKVLEAPKVKTQKQSDPAVIQQIKQEKEIETKTPKVEIQQTEIKKEKVSTHKVVVGNPKEIKKSKIEQQKEGENDKKFNLPSEPKKESEIVNTQEVIEERPECDTSSEEPNVSTTTQSSAASSTSTSKTPRYKVLEKRGTKEEKDAGFETYDVNNQPIDIEDESVKLYNKFLDQVLEEFEKEEKIVNIDLIKKKVEEKLFACFSIRNEKGETISKDHYSKKDEKDIELAKKDYKYTAEHSESIQNRFNAIEEALKEYNKRLAGANKEIQEKLLQQQAIASKA